MIFLMQIALQSLIIVITMQYFFIISLTLDGSPNSTVKYSETSTSLQGLMNLGHFLDILPSVMVIFCSMLAMIANSLMYLATKNPIRLTYHGRQGTRTILLLNSSYGTLGTDIGDRPRLKINSLHKQNLQRSK